MSVIIPAYNELRHIGRTIGEVRGRAGAQSEIEIIVADGGSTDGTPAAAREAGASVIRCARKGRAVQMNEGAAAATGRVLYFLHADSIPPDGFDRLILDQVGRGNTAGCFRLEFDWNHPILDGYAWFTRFDINAFRFGDQSLFVTRRHFAEAGKFREDLAVMEDNEIIRRLKQAGPFVILPQKVITSARKYRENGVIRLQAVFTLIYLLYHLGVRQEKLVQIYKRCIG